MEEATNRRILNGWKQISNHIDRGVRTAQRWEALLGMPVHRPALKDRSAVVAFSDELESWLSRTLPDVRNECVETDDRATHVQEWNERLLRALDNMSTLVRQSCDLLFQVQMLQEQLRRSRKSRRVASGTIALRPRGHVASARRSVGSVLPFPHRKHLSRIERTAFAAMVDRSGIQ
jgi:hypothetical protein